MLGNWKADWRFKDDEQTEFLRFIRRMLNWVPEERASAKELLEDPFIKNEMDMDEESDEEETANAALDRTMPKNGDQSSQAETEFPPVEGEARETECTSSE